MTDFESSIPSRSLCVFDEPKFEHKFFEHEEFGKFTTIIKNGKDVFFIGNEVATALGYSNPSRSVQDHCKYPEILKPTFVVGLNIPPRGWLIIPESDVYRLVMRSKMPAAEAFQDWLVEEVLPALRKSGRYEVEAPSKTQQVLDVILMLQNDLATEKNLRLEAERTKAMIGDKKVATAMATASAASRKVTVLKRKNQVLKEENQVLEEENQTFKKQAEEEAMFVTVLVMEAKHKRNFAWQPLKKSSIANGIEIKKVLCPRFGTANAYHKKVWEDVYGI